MTRIASIVRPALAALLLGTSLVPGTAHAYRVFFGYGYGLGYPYPYYYRPPVVVVPPPAYYAPPYVAPRYYTPAYAPGPYSTRCNTGVALCPLPAPAPVGGACSCPGAYGRLNGRIG